MYRGVYPYASCEKAQLICINRAATQAYLNVSGSRLMYIETKIASRLRDVIANSELNYPRIQDQNDGPQIEDKQALFIQSNF